MTRFPFNLSVPTVGIHSFGVCSALRLETDTQHKNEEKTSNEQPKNVLLTCLVLFEGNYGHLYNSPLKNTLEQKCLQRNAVDKTALNAELCSTKVVCTTCYLTTSKGQLNGHA